ncbi:MAG TPA: hypothetical protein VFM29_02555 [Vicinamibacteria bacterium]|nr:hypothetical protein [Vicinamibacteria bacterium]
MSQSFTADNDKLALSNDGERKYEKPTVRIIEEKEILSAFQVSIVAATWWGM